MSGGRFALGAIVLLWVTACSSGIPAAAPVTGPESLAVSPVASAPPEGSTTMGARPMPVVAATALIYDKGAFYVRWTPGSHAAPKHVMRYRSMRPWGVTAYGQRVYWISALTKSIEGASVSGKGVHALVRHVGFEFDLVATRRYVYWGGPQAIGRVPVNGGQVDRRYQVLPQTGDGDEVQDGLATDGRYLYFSQCERNRIGRVMLSAHGSHPHITWIVHTPCPQALAVDGRYIYWGANLASADAAIGRVPAAGGPADPSWTRVHDSTGPLQIVADGHFIYWTWGGTVGRPTYFGRVNVDHSSFARKWIRIGGGAVSGDPN